MKRMFLVLMAVIGVGMMITGVGVSVSAQRGGGRGGRGRGMSPEMQARLAKQAELEKSVPEIPFDVVPLNLKTPPDRMIGETEGVAISPQGHIFVYTRTGTWGGPARGAIASRLYEFTKDGDWVKEWGQGNYGFSFAHDIKFDKYGNLWAVDEGSNMVMKFNAQGQVTMVLGRKPEAIDYLEQYLEEGRHPAEDAPPPVGSPNTFNRPTDVTWDNNDNIFVSDGYGNSRVAKFTKDGDWVGTVGTRGDGPDQFNTPHAIASDAQGNIYVADRGNSRVQVYSPDLKFIRSIDDVRAPWAICITPGPTQYLYSADAGGKIYKTTLDGKLLGWFGTLGKRPGQFYWVHEMACPSENEIYTGEAQNWRVQHLMLHPPASAR